MKKFIEGTPFEVLIAGGKSGFSRWYEKKWVVFGNLRRSKPVVEGALAAQVGEGSRTLVVERPILQSHFDAAATESFSQTPSEIIAESGPKLSVTSLTRKKYWPLEWL